MNHVPPSVRVATRLAAEPRVPAGRRRLSLSEIVRDLAGWTLPARPPAPGRQPATWQLA